MINLTCDQEQSDCACLCSVLLLINSHLLGRNTCFACTIMDDLLLDKSPFDTREFNGLTSDLHKFPLTLRQTRLSQNT